MTHPSPPPKRRVLYIRHKRAATLSEGYRMNQDEWVETMSMLADVTLMMGDFDMDEVCDRVHPDFILYESPALFPAPLNISNPTAHPDIPRIGFQMQDAYCSTRVNFLRTLETLNIQWMFTHMTDMALRQSPELKTRTFSISHLFDDRVFHDYGPKKDIPVSIFGGFLVPEIYKWRDEITREIPQYFPTLIYTHPGYIAPIPRHKFPVSGVDYAQLLNRSHFSLADTTRFDCFLRKHLEIPAAGAVLVAPDASALKPYGFKDMENCILGSGKALYDKIAAVADNPEAYETIRKNGYDLVHAKYSRKNWRGILDFYEGLRTLKAGETIQQQGVFGPFRAVPATPVPLPAIVGEYPDNEISSLAKLWLENLLHGTGQSEIEARMSKMASFFSQMTEQWIPMGITALLKGDRIHAKEFFQNPQTIRMKEGGFADYDPEEIAWLSLTAALAGDAELLKMTQREAGSMRHLSLRRIQWLGKVLASGGDVSNPPIDVLHRAHDDRLSIHWTGQLDIKDWIGLIRRILNANGQGDILKSEQT